MTDQGTPEVSGNQQMAVLGATDMESFFNLADEAAAELHPDLVPWVEDGQWGRMLRHPLVYQIPLALPGHANKAYEYKRKATQKASEEGDWHTYIYLHERAYRLMALVESVLGRYEESGEIIPLEYQPQHAELVLSVWIDSENIQQNEEEWRQIFNGDTGTPTNFWLGDAEDRAAFNALPDPIPAYRGGVVGDWSWTTDPAIAEFFYRRSGYEPRFALIPKADCFGYTTDRGESELFVRLTPEREPLVYPDRFPETRKEEPC